MQEIQQQIQKLKSEILNEIKCGIENCHSLIWLKDRIKEYDFTKKEIIELLEHYIVQDNEII